VAAGNDVLRREMAAAGLSPAQLAEKVGVDEKTCARWIADAERMPHPKHRHDVATVLGVEADVLWPNAVKSTLKTGWDREVLAVYPSHSAVPASVWQSMVLNARRDIVFCDTVSYWYWFVVPDLSSILRERAEAGCRVRVIIGDPDDPAVRADEESTNVPLTLTSRIEQTRHLLAPLRDVVEVRQTREGFGRSVYRGDDTAAAHWWLHGQLGIDFPVMHLRRRLDGGLFDQVAVRHVEALWEAARSVG
jgi:lambda repressor-like predicted transcriptional regulator